MDQRLQHALDFANYRQTLTVQRKTLKEKIDSKLTYGYNGGLFKIDQTLLCFVNMLESTGRTENIVLIDSNDNPILIENLSEFKDEILDRYFTSSNEYYNEYKKLKSSRTVEKLINYE